MLLQKKSIVLCLNERRVQYVEFFLKHVNYELRGHSNSTPFYKRKEHPAICHLILIVFQNKPNR